MSGALKQFSDDPRNLSGEQACVAIAPSEDSFPRLSSLRKPRAGPRVGVKSLLSTVISPPCQTLALTSNSSSAMPTFKINAKLQVILVKSTVSIKPQYKSISLK